MYCRRKLTHEGDFAALRAKLMEKFDKRKELLEEALIEASMRSDGDLFGQDMAAM